MGLSNKRIAFDLLIQKYSEELTRKDRIESKAIGYYTVLGISFTAFLVIVPFWLDKLLTFSCTIQGSISYSFLLLSGSYIIVLFFAFISIHGIYKPKNRAEITPIAYWKNEISGKNKSDFLDEVYDHIVTTVQMNETSNNEMVALLERVNNLVFVLMAVSATICVLAVFAWFLK